MRRAIPVVAVALFLLGALPLLAVDRNERTVVDDVIRMTAAGVADETIISFVQKTRDAFDVTADDVIAMTDAKVSRAVIRAVVDESNARGGRREASAAPATRVYVSPFPYYYDPYYSFYDPFWYGPRVYLNFGFGGIYRGGHGIYRGGYGRRGRH